MDALVTSVVPVGGPQLAEYPRARMVLTCSTGTDHLDVEALRAFLLEGREPEGVVL